MKTMPRPVLGLMRFVVFVMLAVVGWWEDRYAHQGDHRMAALNAGLWQAEQALRQVRVGDFKYVPQPLPPRPMSLPAPQQMRLTDDVRNQLKRAATTLRSVD